MDDVSTMTDSELAYRLLMANELIQKHEQELEAARNMKAGTQRELDRRALDAWWAAHPEQTRVNVGDRLLATDAFWALVEPNILNARNIWKRGVWVTSVQPANERVMIGNRKGSYSSSVGLNINFASRMRAAYLQAHPESEADR